MLEQLLSLAHTRFDISANPDGDDTDLAKKFKFAEGDVIQFMVKMQGKLNIETSTFSNSNFTTTGTSTSANETAEAIFSSTPGVSYDKTTTPHSGTVHPRIWRISLQLKA